MPRLFTAIDLPDTVKATLSDLQTDIPRARWVKAHTMHLTLHFIGADVPEDHVEPMQAALATVQAAPFTLRISGMGRFPPSRKKAPRVLWAAVDGGQSLLDLHAAIGAALRPTGYKPEQRLYRPHITLARMQAHKPTVEADAFLDQYAATHFASVPVREFVLMQSVLSPQGPRYTPLKHYALNG